MSAYTEAEAKNKRYHESLLLWFNLLPRALLSVTVDYTLGKVMEPAERNFSPSLYDSVTGEKMPHSSSNAAYNWRVAVGANFEGYLDYKSKGVVGAPFAERSNNQDPAMYKVINARRNKDIKPLYSKMLSGKSKDLETIYLYNPVSGDYAYNANLEAVTAAAYRHADVGYARAKAIVESYEGGGNFNSKGLKSYLFSVVMNKG